MQIDGVNQQVDASDVKDPKAIALTGAFDGDLIGADRKTQFDRRVERLRSDDLGRLSGNVGLLSQLLQAPLVLQIPEIGWQHHDRRNGQPGQNHDGGADAQVGCRHLAS